MPLLLEFTAPVTHLPYYYVFDFVLWIAFVVDLLWRHHITVDRATWFWRDRINWLDLVVVLSFPALITVHIALLGAARIGRLLVIVVRLSRGAGLVGATATRAERFFRRGTLALLSVIAGELVVTLTTRVSIALAEEQRPRMLELLDRPEIWADIETLACALLERQRLTGADVDLLLLPRTSPRWAIP